MSDWLRELLASVQLENFYLKFREDDITLPSHFDHLPENYLTKKGLSAPAQKRLLAAVKKARKAEKKYVKKHGPISERQTSAPISNQSSGHLIDEGSLALGPELGDGSFGVVREGIWTTGTKTVKVAVKSLKLDEDINSLRDFMLEITAMHRLSHDGLLPLYGVVLGNPLKLVTQLAPKGNLLSHLRARNLHSLLRLTEYAVQVARGMRHLAAAGFVHRDLAARNILLFTDERVKIGDFGLMRRVNQKGEYTMEERRKIPIAWSPPESLRKRLFSEKSDVWSFGVLLWEILSKGTMPWKGSSAREIATFIEQGVRLERPVVASDQIWAIMKSCWNFSPAERPNFESIANSMVNSVPPECAVVRDHFDGDSVFVRRGQSVYAIRDLPDLKLLAQCCASLEVAPLPRSCLAGDSTLLVPFTKESSQKAVVTKDISAPVKNSFVHVAHGAANPADGWGKPDAIPQHILANPVNPAVQGPQNRPKRGSQLRASRKAPPAPKKVPVQCCNDLVKLEPQSQKSFAEMHNEIGKQLGQLTDERPHTYQNTDYTDGTYYQPPQESEPVELYYRPCWSETYSYNEVYGRIEINHRAENETVSDACVIELVHEMKHSFDNSENFSQKVLSEKILPESYLKPAQSYASLAPSQPYYEPYQRTTSTQLIPLNQSHDNIILPTLTPSITPTLTPSITPTPAPIQNPFTQSIEEKVPFPTNDRYNPFRYSSTEPPPRQETPPSSESFRDLESTAFKWFEKKDVVQAVTPRENKTPPIQEKVIEDTQWVTFDSGPSSPTIINPIVTPPTVPKQNVPPTNQATTPKVPPTVVQPSVVTPEVTAPTVSTLIEMTSPIVTPTVAPMKVMTPTVVLPTTLASTVSTLTPTLITSRNVRSNEVELTVSKPTVSPTVVAPSVMTPTVAPPVAVAQPKVVPTVYTSRNFSSSITSTVSTPINNITQKATPTVTTTTVSQPKQMATIVNSPPVGKSTLVQPTVVAPKKPVSSKKQEIKHPPKVEQANKHVSRESSLVQTSTPKIPIEKLNRSNSTPLAPVNSDPSKNLALMNTSDAVKLLRQKYLKTPSPTPQAQSAPLSTMDKFTEMQVNRLCDHFNNTLTKAEAQMALKANKNDLKKSIRSVKIVKLRRMAPQSDCDWALQRANGDPDIALNLLKSKL